MAKRFVLNPVTGKLDYIDTDFATWGDISGDITQQTDLINYLTSKYAKLDGSNQPFTSPLNIQLNSSSTQNDLLTLTQLGAFAASPVGLRFFNSPGNIQMASIEAIPGASYMDSQLRFFVADSSKVRQQRMVIDVTGKIGIGVTSPTASLDILAPSQTGSGAVGGFNLQQTWNTSGNPNAFKINVTNTANGGNANLMTLGTNNNPLFVVTDTGTVYGSGINNISGGAFAAIMANNTGATISRNVADSNPSLIVNQINASSTGDILDLKAAGTTKVSFALNGDINTSGNITISGDTTTKGLNVTGTPITITGAVTNLVVTTPTASPFFGDVYIRIYAYKLSPDSVRVFSTTYNDNGGSAIHVTYPHYIHMTWTGVAGADGYVVVTSQSGPITNPNGLTYFETTSNAIDMFGPANSSTVNGILNSDVSINVQYSNSIPLNGKVSIPQVLNVNAGYNQNNLNLINYHTLQTTLHIGPFAYSPANFSPGNILIGNVIGGTGIVNSVIAGIGALPNGNASGLVLIGNIAGDFSTGSNSVIIGANANGGGYSVYIGGGAGDTATGYNNVALGRSALPQNAGGENVCSGYSSGAQLINGTKNVFLGANTGENSGDVSNSIYLGYSTGFWETASNILIVDSFQRSNEADQRAKAIIYGVMDSSPANQTLVFNSKLGIGITPTANLHLKAGTTAANTAPLKLTSGSLLTSAETGAYEFLTDKFYGTITTETARKEFTLNDTALTSGRIPVATTNGRLKDFSGLTWDTTYGLKAQTIYASTYGDNVTLTTGELTANVPVIVPTGLTQGSTNGFTWNATNNVLTAQVAGKYKVDWAMSVMIASGANIHVEGSVRVNSTSQVQTKSVTHLVTSNDEQPIGGTGIITLAANDTVQLEVENDDGTQAIIVTHANLTLERIDN